MVPKIMGLRNMIESLYLTINLVDLYIYLMNPTLWMHLALSIGRF